MSETRIGFYLSDLVIEVISEKMKEHNLDYEKDFDKYFQKTVTHEIEKSGFKNCDTFSCRVKKNQFKNPLTTKKLAFIQCLSNKKSTTLSGAISVLLLRGFPTKKEIELENLFQAIKSGDQKQISTITQNIKNL
jgi:hypothetical protein